MITAIVILALVVFVMGGVMSGNKNPHVSGLPSTIPPRPSQEPPEIVEEGE